MIDCIPILIVKIFIPSLYNLLLVHVHCLYRLLQIFRLDTIIVKNSPCHNVYLGPAIPALYMNMDREMFL